MVLHVIPNINMDRGSMHEKNSLPENIAIFGYSVLIDVEFLSQAEASSFQAVRLDCLSVCCIRLAIVSLSKSS